MEGGEERGREERREGREGERERERNTLGTCEEMRPLSSLRPPPPPPHSHTHSQFLADCCSSRVLECVETRTEERRNKQSYTYVPNQ